MIKRRSAIEPVIGHMKSDGKLGRNWLKGRAGDAIHALLCGAGHNDKHPSAAAFLRLDDSAVVGDVRASATRKGMTEYIIAT